MTEPESLERLIPRYDREQLDRYHQIVTFERSTFGGMLEKGYAYSGGSEPCGACGDSSDKSAQGSGFTDDGECCPACHGMGFVPRKKSRRPIRADHWTPSANGSTPGGIGTLEALDAIPQTQERPEPSYEPADWELFVVARVSRRLGQVERRSRLAAAVLGVVFSVEAQAAHAAELLPGGAFPMSPFDARVNRILAPYTKSGRRAVNAPSGRQERLALAEAREEARGLFEHAAMLWGLTG